MANALDYGFKDLARLAGQRVTQVGAGVVDEAIVRTVTYHTTLVNAVMASWVERTTVQSELVHLPSAITLQPLSESGNPNPVDPANSYTAAYPIQGGGHAWGDNRVTRAKMTVGEIQRQVNHGLTADTNWMRRHAQAAVLDDTSYTYTDPDFGSLTILPLANGDTVTYPRKNDTITTDDHYLAQANAIDDSNNPFPAIFDELSEHPSNGVSDQFPIVCYIAKSLQTTVGALTSFTAQLPVYLQAGISGNSVGAGLRSLVPFGEGVLGVVGETRPIIIALWETLPDGYMIAHATGAGPFLKMREHAEASLQGLFRETNSPDGNHQEYRLLRYAGFGCYNRVAAVVQQIGNATYQIPTGFATPLPN